MKNNKREEQQGKTKKEQGENTYIRIRTTNIKTVHVIQTQSERQENVRNNTQQERREDQEETR